MFEPARSIHEAAKHDEFRATLRAHRAFAALVAGGVTPAHQARGSDTVDTQTGSQTRVKSSVGTVHEVRAGVSKRAQCGLLTYYMHQVPHGTPVTCRRCLRSTRLRG